MDVAERAAAIFVTVLTIYLVVGFLVAIPLVVTGIGRFDPAARQGSWGFRLIILPGAIALWPVLARRWWSGAQVPPEEVNPHRPVS